MCGIAGIFSYANDHPIDVAELERIEQAMIARGPDGRGIWQSDHGRIGLAHRRLAIIDPTPSGAQPMHDSQRGLTITYNGEIYNYRELQEYLRSKGYELKTDSDTEVLLGLYAVDGHDMTHRLRGMYAFAIWDERNRTCFAARDPYGIKPFYYADQDGSLRFASTVKALMAGGSLADDLDPAAQVGFLLLGYVPEPNTIRAAIKSLPAGHSLTITEGRQPEIRSFFRITDLLRRPIEGPPPSLEERRERLRDALEDSVAHHMVADVPVGFFLSAGLDSTALVSLAGRGSSVDAKTVTLCFDATRGTRFDESELAEMVAGAYGTEHHTVEIKQSDFAEDRDRVLAAMDQPSTDGVNTYFVSKAVRSIGLKTALSGAGGDEILAGYESFDQIPRLVRRLRHVPGVATFGKGFRMVSGPLIRRLTSPKFAGLFEYGTSVADAYILRRGLYMPWELPSVLDPEIIKSGWETLDLPGRLKHDTEGIGTLEGQVAALEASWYLRGQLLRDADWAGMANSLEIRVPFVDRVLLERISDLVAGPARLSKQDLAALTDHRMPEAVRTRQKTGFHVPVRDWIAEGAENKPERGLRGWARFLLDQVDA